MRDFHNTIRNFLKSKVHYATYKCNLSSVSSHNLKGPWKVVFFGSDDFAMESLKMLYSKMKSQCLVQELSIVCAQNNCPVAKFGVKNNLKLINWKPSVNQILETGAHIGLVASFGHLIPSKIISSFPLGMLNVHASILPRWRGAAPIVHAIMHKDKITGVTIMNIRPHKFDEGEILRIASCDIGSHETTVALTKRLSLLGAQELKTCLQELPDCLLQARVQTSEGVTYAPKIVPAMAICDWVNMSSDEIYRRRLALEHIYPLETTWQGQCLRLLECTPSATPRDGEPGTINFDWKQRQLIVSCKDSSAIQVKRVKLPNKPTITAVDFLNGYLKKLSKDSWKFYHNLIT